jgi:ABC-type amino acid transport substrate-binding protein
MWGGGMTAWRFLPCMVVVFVLFAGGMQTGQAEPVSDCSRPLVIRASETYSPFSMKDKNGVAVGIDNVFIAKIMKRVGCEYRFEFLPWKRSLYGIEHGDIDVLPSASLTEEREAYGLFSVPYRNDVIGFVVRNGDAGRVSLGSLDDVIAQNLVIGQVRGAYRGEAFEAFATSPEGARHVIDVSVAPHGLQLLLANRIDLLLGIPAAYIAQAESQGYGDTVEEHPFLLGKEPVRLMFSKKNIAPGLVRKISDAIIAESQTAQYRALYGVQGIGIDDLADSH